MEQIKKRSKSEVKNFGHLAFFFHHLSPPVKSFFDSRYQKLSPKPFQSALSQSYVRSLNFHVSHPILPGGTVLPSSQETDDFHEVGPAGHQIPFGS